MMSRVIVKNLPSGIKEERVRQLFGDKGTVTDCSLKYTPDGMFRKFAFVGFQTEAEANAAVEYFDKTFVDTSRIYVSLANNLGDSYKNRPWSVHSKNKDHSINAGATEQEANTKPEKLKKSFENDLLKDLESNVEFKEFLEVHKPRANKSTWSNDIVLSSSAELPKDETLDVVTSQATLKHDSLPETVENKPKKTNKLSDLEYLKSKMTKDFTLSDEENESENEASQTGGITTEQEVANKTVRFLIKMKGLASNIKESQIQEFFKPVIPVKIHLSRNRQTGRMATVEFLSDTDQAQALRRNKNYIGTRKIFLHKLTETIKETTHDKKPRTWELKHHDGELKDISESGQLFVRNLSYSCTEEDLKALFQKFGCVEASLPVDKFTKKIMGFAIVTYTPPENAIKAYAELDGAVFQGRMLHILPSRAKPENDEITDDMSYKKKKQLLQKANASSAHNWNALFVGGSAVADVMALKYGKTKEEILTQGGKKDSIGVRMALGETQIVAEIRQFLLDNGVSLDSFSQPSAARSKTVLLVKHLPAGTIADEIRELFEKYGTVGRLVLPPGGLTAIVEYVEQTEARAGFRALAYTKFKHLPLYLEWAPVDVFTSPIQKDATDVCAGDKSTKRNNSDSDDDVDDSACCTLFVKNLNFKTTEDQMKQLFKRVGKVRNVTIARKKDKDHPGQLLSMGYGFVEFKSPDSAKEALKIMQHTSLDDHQLELKFTNRTTVKSELRKQKSGNMKQKNSTKILVRNVPFETKLSEIQQLFCVFGELKSVRMPKKVSGTGKHRGFAFIDFLTKEDAKRAFDALCHSTHLYGRRLVLEWADTESDSLEALRKKTADHFVEDEPSGKRLKKSSLLDRLDSSVVAD